MLSARFDDDDDDDGKIKDLPREIRGAYDKFPDFFFFCTGI